MPISKKLDLGIGKTTCKFQSAAAMVLLFIFMSIFYLSSFERRVIDIERMSAENSIENCDLFSGKWVFDNKSYPLYDEKQCTFMIDDYSCQKFGREEFKYRSWRWQPHGCDLPRFNGTTLLEKLRDKRVVFAGDSLAKNQWVSMLCLIDSWIPDPSQKASQMLGNLITFNAFEYNASVDFYWEPMLVESNGDNTTHHHAVKPAIVVDSIEKHARNWIDADILVFSFNAWWYRPNITLVWGTFENPIRTRIESTKLPPYKMAIETWSNYLEAHLNQTKTRLFVASPSPHHWGASRWGGLGPNCHAEKEPISEEGDWGYVEDIELRQTAESVVERLRSRGFNTQFLNITRLSAYRKDGHSSIYKRHWFPPTQQELADPITYADCLHWCLPGVPDVWNEILYSYILHHS